MPHHSDKDPEVAYLVAYLQEKLRLQESLIQQLVQEVFWLTQKSLEQPLLQAESQSRQAELQRRVADLETQLTISQAKIMAQDREIEQLRQVVQNLTHHNQQLEQALQTLPQVYREKFFARMAPIAAKVAVVQQENRALRAALEEQYCALSAQVADGDLDLPRFRGWDSGSGYG